MRWFKTGLLLILSALLPNLAFPPHDWHLLGWVAFVPFFLLLDCFPRSLPRQLLVTIITVALAYAYGYRWIAGTLHEFARLPLPLCYLLLLGFCALGSLSLTPFVIMRHVWRRSSPLWGHVLLVGLLWVAMELWTPRLFPWFAGLTQHAAPIPRQIAELGGIRAVSLVVIWCNLAVYTFVRVVLDKSWGHLPQWLEGFLILALVCGSLLWANGRQTLLGHLYRATARSLKVALVQGNVENEIKRQRFQNGDTGRIESADRRYLRLTLTAAAQKPDLIVWPETAFSYFINLEGALNAIWRRHHQLLQGIARRSQATLLVGGLEASGQPQGQASGFSGERNYNVALLVPPEGPMQSYRKQILIPFGERLPWPLNVVWPGLKRHMPRRFEFSAGASVPVMQVQGARLAVTICYEAILESYVRGQVRTQDPHLLVNLTNDSWFGRSAEPYQHLALASFQAIAHRRPLVRATNNGISAYVDPLGQRHNPTDLFQTAVRVYDIPMLELTRPTVYTRWGNAPLGIAALMALILSGLNGWYGYRTRKVHE